ncbi:MAG: sigma-54 dependent transcriptional regulator [Cytophagales bacterium]
MNKILIIDDDRDTLSLLKGFFSKKGYEVSIAANGKKGLDLIRNNSFSVILCDFRLPDTDGLEMIQKIKILDDQVKIIIITGYSETKMAVEALKLGAIEYVTKPLQPDEILQIVKDASKDFNSKNNSSTINQEYVIGDSRHAQNIYQQIELIAPTDMSVIISGETGTGKEYVAQAIHTNSRRKDKPFVAVDCGALPEELAGSELFGHVKGAFTGALKSKKGCFELANSGTLFLDEVGNLSYENQVKLLRVIQEGKVRKIGAEKEINVDVRILVATNEHLEAKIDKGEFRLDLYHRINEFKIELHPLRERHEDIEKFSQIFLANASKSLMKNVDSFSNEAFKLMKSYPWEGNLRELQNAIKKAVLFCKGKEISADDLPGEIKLHSKKSIQEEEEIIGYNLKENVARTEAKTINRALQASNDNKSEAAKLLGIDRKTLYNKMKSLDLI